MPTKDRSLFHVSVGTGYDTKRSVTYNTRQTAKIVRTVTGVPNPKWRSQIANGQNAATNLDGTFDFLECDYASADLYWNSIYPCYPPTSAIFHDHIEGQLAHLSMGTNENSFWNPIGTSGTADNRARIAFLKRVRQVQVGFSLPTFAGELKETIRMIRNPARGLRDLASNYLKRVKSSKKKNPLGWKKNLSDLWLEQAFGWKPLINDIETAWDVYKNLTDKPRIVRIRGFGADEFYKGDWPMATFPIGNSAIRYKGFCNRTEVYKVIYKGAVRAQADAPKVEKLERFGFEPLEWLPTAWELLPWSFMIDYFSNIGDVIQAECAYTSNVLWCNRDSIRTLLYSGAIGLDDTSKYGKTTVCDHYLSCSGNSSTAKHGRRSVTRTANVIVSTPSLSFEIPGRPAQWANMTALFAQVTEIHPQRTPRRRGF